MPDRFQPFSGEIVKFRTDGHRIVRAGRRNVDIGPTRHPVGTTVRALLVSKTHAICLEDNQVSNSYDEYLKELNDRFDISPQAARHIPYQYVEYNITPDETFTAEIEKIGGGSVGYVNLAGEQLNIGPVCAEQGQKVNLRYMKNGFAYCTDRHLQAENYENRMAILSEQYDQVPVDIGETYRGEVTVSQPDTATVMINGVHINIQNPDLSEDQIVKVEVTDFAKQSANGVAVDHTQPQTSDSSTLEESDTIGSNSEVDSSETSDGRSDDQPSADIDTDTSASAETTDGTREPAEGSDVAEPDPTDAVGAIEDEGTRDAPTTVVESVTSTASSKPTSQPKSLRAEAEAAASDNPVRDTSSTGGGSRYQRAPEIKEYARARANGVCEVCDEPAPFETDDGRPYLEIHHIEELGQGGEDHPDKVAAVCPTCHKRIHHGADGDALNEGLRERLEKGLADVGTGVDDSTE